MTVPLSWLPRRLSDKESTCSAGDSSSIPGLGRSPVGGNGNPLQYSCLENPMDRGAWWATVHGVAESDTTEQLNTTMQSQSAWAAGTEPLWLSGCHVRFSKSWWRRGPRSRPWRQILNLLRFTDGAFLPSPAVEGAGSPWALSAGPAPVRPAAAVPLDGRSPCLVIARRHTALRREEASLPTGYLLGSLPTLSSQ